MSGILLTLDRKMSRRRRERGIPHFVNQIQKKGIKLVALDFDLTLISVHSGGIWKDSIEKLIPLIRPCFKQLIEVCLDRGINVCIVTYFSQPWVIRQLLHQVFHREAEKIIVQANTPAFVEKHNYEFYGKEAHMASVLTELYNRGHLKIRAEEIILIDDSRHNTETALRFGHLAFHVPETVAEKDLEDFATSLDTTTLRKSWVK